MYKEAISAGGERSCWKNMAERNSCWSGLPSLAGRNPLLGGIPCWEEFHVGGILCWEESLAGRNSMLEESCAGRNPMSKESSVGGILCWDKSGVIKVNAKAKKYESLGGILLGGIHQEESCVGGILCGRNPVLGGIL